MASARDKSLRFRKRPSQKRSTESVDQILSHAAAILDEVGVEEFSTNEISRRSGITIGSIYHYFPNKEAIVHELCTRWLDIITDKYIEFERLRLDGSDAEAYWTSLVDCLYRGYSGTPAIHAVTRATEIWPTIRELDVKYDESAMKRVATYLQNTGVSASKREMRRLSTLVLNQLHHVIMLAIRSSTTDARKILADLVALLVNLTERYK